MPQIKRNPHCVNQINYYLVWVPGYRHKVLTGPVANRLKEICHQVAVELGVEILALEVLPDHVHLFVSCPPKWSPSEIVRRLKGRRAGVNQPYAAGEISKDLRVNCDIVRA
jgi:putative transposase